MNTGKHISLYKPFFFVLVLLSQSCGKREPTTLFTKMNGEDTDILFSNVIEETESLNVMQYEYLYNGGGVGIGDFNSDGLADIYVTGNAVNNKLFLNKGDFQFEDVTEKCGAGGRRGWKTGVSIADVDGDGRLDNL